MKRLLINTVLYTTVLCINVGCTTRRITIDDHSYHHNDTPGGNTIINHHYPQTIIQPTPSIQQQDRDFLQYSQGALGYMPQRSYPPVGPNGPAYPNPPVFTHVYQVPTYTNYALAYR